MPQSDPDERKGREPWQHGSEAETAVPGPGKEPSSIARSVSRLRAATFRAVDKRERLTQPLFWSLFTTELVEIKRAKEDARLRRKLLLGIE